jgi:hypothetical protein
MIVNLLTDAPKHNHALMKISTYHKERGDDVYLNFPLVLADRTYVSLLFSDSVGSYSGDVLGGSAFFGRGVPRNFHQLLQPDIECCRPDLGLFKTDYSVGYSFRPCFRNCSFCQVSRMPMPDNDHHSIWEFHDSRFSKICLLNNNTFLDKQWKETFEEIWDAKLTVVDENGYDLRLLDEEKAIALKKTKFNGKLHFAWDRVQDEKEILCGLGLLKKHKIIGSFYVLTGFDTSETEDIYRCQILKEYKQDIYVMPYGKTKIGMKFKRFIDSYMWRKYKTIEEAWKDYKPMCRKTMSTKYKKEVLQPDTVGRLEYAKRYALNLFDKWNDVTDFPTKHTSYYYEIQSLIEDAAEIGFAVAYGQDAEKIVKKFTKRDHNG